jgi:DNA recombination protein RmuC
VQNAVLSERAARLDIVDKEISGLRKELDGERAEHGKTLQRVTALTTRNEEQGQAAEKELSVWKDAETRLGLVFKDLSQQILDAKVGDFDTQSKAQLGALIKPLTDQMNALRDAALLQTQAVQTLREHTEEIGKDAINLTRALKGDSGMQGAWGEVVLERVLELSGLQEGRGYTLQTVFKAEDGGRPRPDVIIRLPVEKDVVLDAKVSLTAYERFVSATDDVGRKIALKDHVLSVRRHIDGLSRRDYSSLPGLRTLDFVLLFVPVEAAFIDAVREDDSLYTYALDRNIVVVGPSTLLATLRTINHLWKVEDRGLNAAEIARQAGDLHDYFALLVDGIQDVGEKLANAQISQRGLLRRLTEGGKGSILLKVHRLKELGAKAKKSLPPTLLYEAGADERSIESIVGNPEPENDNGAE